MLRKLFRSIFERFPFPSTMYRDMRDRRKLFKEAKETPLGFKFIGNQQMEQGLFEVEETKIVKKILQKTEIFINIGANIGYYCCLALNMHKKTIAFEPINTNLMYLYKNAYINGWDDIEVYPIVLSNHIGLIEIFGGGTGASLVEGWAGTSKNYYRLVPTSTLDHILGNKFKNKKCFFLVDVEGAEKSVLDGALKYLNMFPKPIWMIEIVNVTHWPAGMKTNPNFLSTFQMFWERGYKSWTVASKPKVVTEKDVLHAINQEVNTFGVNNFLFVDESLELFDLL